MANSIFGRLIDFLRKRPTGAPVVSQDSSLQNANKRKLGLDSGIDPILEQFDALLGNGIPNAYRIWRAGQKYLAAGDKVTADKYQNLNYLLHNSSIPNSVKIGEGVQFGYGGIGLVIHDSCEIERFAVIGANVTLGGRAGGSRTSPTGKRIHVPHVCEYAYISVGSVVLGGVTVGALSIVGANSVVTKDVAPLSVVSGAPAREMNRITPENCLRYKSTFLPLRSMSASIPPTTSWAAPS